MSWSRTAFELSLPKATGLDVNSNRLPWSAPWMTNKEATRLSLLGSDASRERIALRLFSRLTHRTVSVNPSDQVRVARSRGVPSQIERRLDPGALTCPPSCNLVDHAASRLGHRRPFSTPCRWSRPKRLASGPRGGDRAPSAALIRGLDRGAGNSAHAAAPLPDNRRSKAASKAGDVARRRRPPRGAAADRTCTAGTCRPTPGGRRRSGNACHPEIGLASGSIGDP